MSARAAGETARARDFAEEMAEEIERLSRQGLYRPGDERDSCGVGFVAAIDGAPRRAVVEAGIAALKAVWHRGAVDADGKTGDGAGIHVQIPQDFFKEHVGNTGHAPRGGRLAVGMAFLPRADLAAQETCRVIVETEILNRGYSIYGWRQVPVDSAAIGEKAMATRPEIEQIMIANDRGVDDDRFEQDLYLIRRRIEKQVLGLHITDFYICSLSCRSAIYKGMFLAEHIDDFYPDLRDERFVSNFAIFHQRYSTNTFPTWKLAQPFRMLAHNGEINTLLGNVNWTRAHETRMASDAFGARMEDAKPVIPHGSSDSAALDAVFELLVRAGRSVPEAQAMLIPESWEDGEAVPAAHRALYSYANCVMEPWDGPAAVAATDGRWVVGGMDRNGLRPMRYSVTRDGLLIVGSEAGMVPVREADVIEKGRLGPGKTIGVDLRAGALRRDAELKDLVAGERPYGEWVRSIMPLDSLLENRPGEAPTLDADALRRRQVLFGWSLEEIELILRPMVEDGKEPVGSMGDDVPLAVLSDRYRGMHHFFRQNFSQVTNPPIDSLRERRVMTLKTRLGNLGNVLDRSPEQTRLLQLESPVLTNGEFATMRGYMGDRAADIDCTFDPQGGPDALSHAVEAVCRAADDAVRGGSEHLVLSDENAGPERAPIPMILAAGGVHSHLIREGLRTYASINVRSAECMDVHYFAVLIGVGATTVNACLAQETIADRCRRGLTPGKSLAQALAAYKQAVDNGILKVMSKMGISVLSSYRGGYNFEALGLSRTLVARFFPGMPSRISGVGLAGLQRMVLAQHERAFAEGAAVLPMGGLYRFRHGGEAHAFDGPPIHILQHAVATDSYATYRRYAGDVAKQPPIAVRDLLDFDRNRTPAPLDEVESITDIRRRLVAPGISLGALSPEAHETLSIAMNRIGAKSDSGEGGEGSERFVPYANGDNACSAIKQVASGRFGVTAEYLNNCQEIEIKMAQGAKPGEGGQLPGFKVSPDIARLRHSTPGVTLISPPPHHDIYSIEDLAQLIYDLKQINPDARVCVKLVARTGIGTIAAGVAKANADTILISGHAGGTGASPQSSIRYAGMPWEIGLAEVNQVLTLNRLRHRVKLRVDGGLKTGRDVAVAALLGAEEYGIGTAALVAMGCIMVRQCHSNTCPVGVCTQNPKLRGKFTGSPEKVVNLFSFLAEEVREILAALGARALDDVIGRTELLRQASRGHAHLDDLDLNPLLVQADPGDRGRIATVTGRNEVPDTLDAQMVKDARALFADGEKMQLAYNVRNTHRAIGTRLSSRIVRRFGMDKLQPGHITVRLRGSAGQSLGAWAVRGLKLEVFGDANDYVGKGLSGGMIVVRPATSSPLASNRNTIIGNTVLYGATSGKLFAAGQAGERFCVRNSGAVAAVEGCGAHGCEYMTGGVAAILGPVGDNFGAGMTGGMAFVYDADANFESRANPQTILWRRLASRHWRDALHALVVEHAQLTGSRFAAALLADWDREALKFWQVCPYEMLERLEHPLDDTPAERRA